MQCYNCGVLGHQAKYCQRGLNPSKRDKQSLKMKTVKTKFSDLCQDLGVTEGTRWEAFREMAQSDSQFQDRRCGENLLEVNGKFHLFFIFSTLITRSIYKGSIPGESPQEGR